MHTVMNNDPDDCTDGLQTFSQHAGECWNDSAINMLFFTPRLAPLVRAKTVADFQAWIARPDITAWLDERFHFKNAKQLELFIYYASHYIGCLKERFENWRQRRVVLNATRRRRSCVYSKCSAASGIIASEIVRLQKYPDISVINANVIKALKNDAMPINMVAQIERGITMHMENYKHNFKVRESMEKGYAYDAFSLFLGILLHFYFDKEVLISLDAKPPADDVFAFGYNRDNPVSYFVHIRKYQPSHHINLILHVSLPSIKQFHVIHLLTCANNKQYVYNNNNKTIISSKWLSYFMTPYDDFVQGYYISSHIAEEPNKKYNLMFELLIRYVAYMNFGIRTVEQMEQTIVRTTNQQEANSIKQKQFKLFHDLVFKTAGIRPDSHDFLYHGFGLEPIHTAPDIHPKVEAVVTKLIVESIFFKLFEEHKPTFFVLTNTHLYFICKESVKKVSIEKLENDMLWNVGVYLLKEPKNVILFLMNMYENNHVYMIDTVNPINFVIFTPK